MKTKIQLGRETGPTTSQRHSRTSAGGRRAQAEGHHLAECIDQPTTRRLNRSMTTAGMWHGAQYRPDASDGWKVGSREADYELLGDDDAEFYSGDSVQDLCLTGSNLTIVIRIVFGPDHYRIANTRLESF